MPTQTKVGQGTTYRTGTLTPEQQRQFNEEQAANKGKRIARDLTTIPGPQEQYEGMDASQQYGVVANEAIYQAVAEGGRLAGVSDLRHQEALGFQQGEFDRANQPTVTDEGINQMYGQQADQAAMDAQELMRNVRQHLGGAGVRGGTAGGIAASVEAQRLANLTGAKRDLRIYKMNADAKDRIDRYQRSVGLADLMGEEPSPFLSDVLGSITQIRLGQEGYARGESAARYSADAQKDAAKSASAANMFSGILGAATSLF